MRLSSSSSRPSWASAALVLCACGRPDAPRSAPAGDALDVPPLAPASARLYRVDHAGRTKIDNDAPLEHFKGTTADHEIVPRDAFGKESKASLHLLGTKVGPVAEVSFDLSAR